MVLWQLLRCENEYIMEEYTELFFKCSTHKNLWLEKLLLHQNIFWWSSSFGVVGSKAGHRPPRVTQVFLDCVLPNGQKVDQ